jgi:outer membrane protein assembly factor BamB
VLVDGDTVVCTPGGNEATLLALDKATGEVRWKSVLPGHTDETEGPDLMGTLPIFLALDADGDREISRREMAASVDALNGLDGNGDSELDEREVRGQRDGGDRRRRRGPGFMSTLKALHALDADESGTIEKGEIEGAPARLRELDANGDGKLVQDEIGERFPRPKRSGAGYSSAIAVEIDGVRQYVQFTAQAVVGVAADDGRLLWSYERPSNRSGINCSTPIYLDGYVIAASAYRNGGGMARVTRDDSGAFSAEEVWFSQDMRNHHGGMIVVDGALFGANGGNGGGHLACLDVESGRTLWDAADLNDVEVPKGSIAMADGRLYYRTEDGAVLLIEPSRARYVERGRFEQPDRSSSPAWTHPVIANGMLYVRDQDILFCYDVRANPRRR